METKLFFLVIVMVGIFFVASQKGRTLLGNLVSNVVGGTTGTNTASTTGAKTNPNNQNAIDLSSTIAM